MPPRALLRVSGVWFVLPLAMGAAWLIVGSNSPDAPEYSVAATAHGMLSLILVAPLLAGASAWQSGRLRRGRVLAKAPVRSRLAVVREACMPILLAGMLATAFGITLAVGQTSPLPTMLGVAIMVLVSHAAVGAAAGLVLSPVLAVPCAALLSYLWLALPPALGPAWFNHLTGTFVGCCTVDQTFSPQAAAGATLVAAGWLVVAGMITASRRALRVVPAAAILLIGTMSAGAMLVQAGDDRLPVVDRTDELICATGTIEVCVWPEHASALPRLQRIGADVSARWTKAGITTPRTFSEGPTPGALRFGYRSGATDVEVRASFAAGAIPFPVTCFQATPTAPPALKPDFYGRRVAWLMLVAGIPEHQLATLVAAESAQGAKDIYRRPRAEQTRWFLTGLRTLRQCQERQAR